MIRLCFLVLGLAVVVVVVVLVVGRVVFLVNTGAAAGARVAVTGFLSGGLRGEDEFARAKSVKKRLEGKARWRVGGY